jgi:HSP20 family protein
MRLARFQRPDLSDWSSFNHLTSLRDEINNLFEGTLSNGGSSDGFNTWAPAIDVYEDTDHLLVRAELPGMKKEDIQISLHENVLTLSGERRNQKKYEGSETSREERSFGRFARSISVQKQVDASRVKASYKDGVLTVSLPKAESAKPRQIEVQSN